MSDTIRRHVVVSGRVQGVGFRWSARLEAQRLGVVGYIVNRADSTVEAELEGHPDAVEQMLDWLRQGPPGARVDALEVDVLEVEGSAGFDIR